VVQQVDVDERLVNEAERLGVVRRVERVELAGPCLALFVRDGDRTALLAWGVEVNTRGRLGCRRMLARGGAGRGDESHRDEDGEGSGAPHLQVPSLPSTVADVRMDRP